MSFPLTENKSTHAPRHRLRRLSELGGGQKSFADLASRAGGLERLSGLRDMRASTKQGFSRFTVFGSRGKNFKEKNTKPFFCPPFFWSDEEASIMRGV